MPRIVALIAVLTLLSQVGCSTISPSLKASPSLMNALGMAEYPLKDLRKQYANDESRFLEVEDLEIHYRDVGQGPTIILIHGVMSSLHTWDGWVDELRDNFRVITLDVPGFGLTGAPADLSQFDKDYVVRMFAKFVDYMELDTFSLAGNSLGGYIAARYAAEHPDKVEKLILINPAGYPQDLPWVFELAKIPVVSTLARYAQPPFLVTMNVREVYGDPLRLSKANHYRYIHMSQRPGAREAYLKAMQFFVEDIPAPEPELVENPDGTVTETERSQRIAEIHKAPIRVAFGSIRAPTLLMWGEMDRWIPISLAERWQADLRNARFISYPGVGHIPMEEIPYQTAQDAIAFLSDLNPEILQPKPSVDELKQLIEGGEGLEGFELMEGF